MFSYLKFRKLCRYLHGVVFDRKTFIIPLTTSWNVKV
jgi:hypothetical protein